MRTQQNRVSVVGVGYSKLERRSKRTMAAITLEAALNAIADAGLETSDIDGLTTYPEIPVFGSPQQDGIDVVTCQYMARMLKMGDRLRWQLDSPTLIITALAEATNAIAAGVCDYALVFRAMHNPDSGGGYNAYTSAVAPGSHQWGAPYGVHRGYQYLGCSYRRYMDVYGARPEHMAAFVINNRKNAALNDQAYFRDQPLTVDDYVNSRLLTDSVRLLDCDLPVDGAAAMIVTSPDRARRHAKRCHVAGYGLYTGPSSGLQPTSGPNYDQLMENGDWIGKHLWEQCGFGPRDVSVAQIYDGYSFFSYWWLEALGFCKQGEAFRWIQDGRIARDGELPLNTFGGQLGEGRMHGMGHIVEAARQAMGTTGQRQIKDVKASLAAVGLLGVGSGAVVFTPD